MDDTAARAADWLPYKARQTFNLYELACLLNRQDPERLTDAAVNEYRARNRDLNIGPEQMAAIIAAMPDMLLGDEVAKTLRALMKAMGRPTINAAVHVGEAQKLAAMLGITWPSELQESDRTDAVLSPLRRVTAAEASEEEILDTLARCGFDPLALPAPPKGKQSPAKQAARSALPRMSSAKFNKAWQQLRRDGRIRDKQ